MSAQVLIAGPCMLEGPEVVASCAKVLCEIQKETQADIYLKGSFDKANRSSLSSTRGPGLEVGLALLENARKEFGLRVCTDVHEVWQIKEVSKIVDMIQIPAFLSRQTDLITAAARSGKIVNIKKGQFMDAQAAIQAWKKAMDAGATACWITERGTSFGLGDLVVDFRIIAELVAENIPVIYDATHSVQKPGGHGTYSGGARQFAHPLAMAAAAVGVTSLFAEFHPRPAEALSDQEVQLEPQQFKHLVQEFFNN